MFFVQYILPYIVTVVMGLSTGLISYFSAIKASLIMMLKLKKYKNNTG